MIPTKGFKRLDGDKALFFFMNVTPNCKVMGQDAILLRGAEGKMSQVADINLLRHTLN
jgi:hypothetical protein